MFFIWDLIWDWIRFEAWLLCVRERRPMESICLRSITQIKKENKNSRVSIGPDSSRVALPLQLSNVTITSHTNVQKDNYSSAILVLLALLGLLWPH